MIWRASATSANTMADRNCEPGEIVVLFLVTGISLQWRKNSFSSSVIYLRFELQVVTSN